MKKVGLFFASLVLFAFSPKLLASEANSMGLVFDLQTKINLQIKAQIQPVDPDAVVTSKVVLKSLSTQLLGTQMVTVGLMSTGTMQKIDDEDIESVTVTVLSALDPFPQAMAKIIESTINGISKKGKVQIAKMDESIASAIKKNKEYQTSSRDFQEASTNFQKANSEQLTKMHEIASEVVRDAPSGIFKLLAIVAVFQLVLTGLGGFLQARAVDKLGARISSIKIESVAGAAGDSRTSTPPPVAQEKDGRGGASGMSGMMTSQDSPFKGLPTESLRAIFSDCYWCKKDEYAAWIWRQLAPEAKIQALASWSTLETYVRYLTSLEPQEAGYHADAAYLKPESSHHLSNEDLLQAVRKKKTLWFSLSVLRQQSLDIDLRERLELMAGSPAAEKSAWPANASKPRTLTNRIEITKLSFADEELLFTKPDLLTGEQRKQFPSLVWLALVAPTSRARILEGIPAQALAEIWQGPAAVLEEVRSALPPKKLALVDEYVSKTKPTSESPWLPAISTAALEQLEEAAKIEASKQRRAA